MKTYKLEDGKYIITKDDQGLLSATRHGADWEAFNHDLRFSKVIGAMLNYIDDLEEVLEDKRRLTRELDVALNGPAAAKQAALCDLVSQAEYFKKKNGPALAPRAAGSDIVIVQPKVPLGHDFEGNMDDMIEDMNQWSKRNGSGVRFVYIGEGFNVYIAEDRSNGKSDVI